MKKSKFVLHFNKDAMLRGESAVWVLRYKGRVHNLNEVDVKVPMRTRYRPNVERNTRAVLEGFATEVLLFMGRKAEIR